MSKVKHNGEGETPFAKEKYRASLRRRENAQAKQKRVKKARELGYRCPFYVKDTKQIREKKTVEVPEHKRELYHYDLIQKEYESGDGRKYTKTVYVRVHDGYEIVPAHTITRSFVIDETPVEPYVKQYRIKKSFWKRESNKKIRKLPVDADVVGKHGNYKKLLNIWNEIF